MEGLFGDNTASEAHSADLSEDDFKAAATTGAAADPFTAHTATGWDVTNL